MGRIRMWQFTFDVAADNPILGAGFNFQDAPHLWNRYGLTRREARSVHSAYFEVLGEHGFLGLFLYLAIGMTGLIYAGRFRRLRIRDPNDAWVNELGAAFQASLVGFAVGATFLNKAYFDFYLAEIALLACTHEYLRQRGILGAAVKSGLRDRRRRRETETEPVPVGPVARSDDRPGTT